MIMIGRAALFIAGITMVAACGGGTTTADKKPVQTKTYTAGQLDAALPGVKDIAQAKKITKTCPGDKACVKPEDGDAWSVDIEYTSALTGAAAERAAKQSIADFGNLEVTQNTSVTAAALEYDKRRTARMEFDGPFETDAVRGKTKQEFTFGEKGSGTLEDTTVSGWKGFVSNRSLDLVQPDGSVDSKRFESQILVQQGAVSVSIFVGAGDFGRTLEDCEKLARGLAEDYLARLG